MSETRPLEEELEALLVDTNDQRRRVGQTFWHLYRSLVFWRERGRSFFDTVKAWSAGGASIFQAMSRTLRPLVPHEADERLRRYVASILEQVAGDLERGDHMLVPFLRWIEGRFPELTQMMKDESPESRIYDLVLARALQDLFEEAKEADRETLVLSLRATARDLAVPETTA